MPIQPEAGQSRYTWDASPPCALWDSIFPLSVHSPSRLRDHAPPGCSLPLFSVFFGHSHHYSSCNCSTCDSDGGTFMHKALSFAECLSINTWGGQCFGGWCRYLGLGKLGSGGWLHSSLLST